MLLTGSGDELCGLLTALFQAVAYHCPLSALLPFQSLITESSCGVQLLAPPPFSSALRAPCPLCCMSFQLLLYYSVVFSVECAQSVQGAMLVYPRGSCGNTMCHLFAHLLVCVSQAGWSHVMQLGRPSVFLAQLSVEKICMGWGLGCQSFDSSWRFFLPSVALCLSKIFYLQSSHCLPLPSSHHLGFPHSFFFSFA
jgi:hypothetical protein